MAMLNLEGIVCNCTQRKSYIEITNTDRFTSTMTSIIFSINKVREALSTILENTGKVEIKPFIYHEI